MKIRSPRSKRVDPVLELFELEAFKQAALGWGGAQDDLLGSILMSVAREEDIRTKSAKPDRPNFKNFTVNT